LYINRANKSIAKEEMCCEFMKLTGLKLIGQIQAILVVPDYSMQKKIMTAEQRF
jgi:hypothetical protein